MPIWAPMLFFLVLALAFQWRCVFAGDVFLPAKLLGHAAPWKGTDLFPKEDLPAWNPLRWDGIGQFYPWRKFAAETLRSGYLPLWNPYQFCGTPFVANSQSAVFYPGNLLFVLIPDTAHAFAWSAILHLTLCGWFGYLLLRRLRCTEAASLLGGVVYAYSAWQAAWLQLPTFLATSCWFPLLLRQIYDSVEIIRAEGQSAFRPGVHSATAVQSWSTTALTPIGNACKIGLVIGLMLLAGHLQIALYGLITGACFTVGLLVVRRASLCSLFACIGGLALGLALALPQLLPAVELSRISHRVGKPSAAGFASYTNYALPYAGLVQVALPDFFGGDSDPQNPYWGYYYGPHGSDAQDYLVYHNPAETAIYVGILPLLLSIFACVRGLNRCRLDRRVAFFAALAALAFLLALGTPVNALLYYGIPGFAQSGSPARCLVLWALAAAVLSALGLDLLSKTAPTRREFAVSLGGFAVIAIVGLGLAARANAVTLPGIHNMPLLGNVFVRIAADWLRLGGFLVVGIGLFVTAGRRAATGSASANRSMLSSAPVVVALVILDLFWTSIGANPTARREQVYPETKGIAYLRAHAGHNRIFPINQHWSLFASNSVLLAAVLPPNTATVFGLRDVQGYDSLFSGKYKSYANGFARPNHGILDASPVEVGNIVFFQNANAPAVPETAAAFAIAEPFETPGFPREAVPPITPLDTEDSGMMVYSLPANAGRARLSPASERSSIAWQEDAPTRVTLAIDTDVPAALSLLDAAMPGWRLRVDGHPEPISTRPDNPILRSASLPAGRHVAAFSYEPASFRVGLYAACAALFSISLCGSLLLCKIRLQFPYKKHENIPG